jgi:glyoxylase-like metal-dependent hydrolase (beta-lactamase superfamily II)
MPDAPLSIRQPHGITTIDAHYVHPGYAAIHLIERDGRMAVVDTGTYHSVQYLALVLAERGLDKRDVDIVFITHVHLDHAGGAGRLLEELPNARAVCHPRAVPHLVDPARLVEASRVVYGSARFDELYGAVLPIDASRISPTRDLEQLRLGQSQFQVLHTPGHALHHHVLHDIDAAAVFTGDTFGLSYRMLDSERGPLVFPTTTPTQFDPEQLSASVDRILALGPRTLYLTHFGGVTGVARLGASLKAQIRQCVEIARRHAAAPDRQRAIHDELKRLWLDLLRDHGTRLEPRALDDLLENDLELNAQGLVAWLEREARAKPG